MNKDCITVCICTYKRPKLLECLLTNLIKQKTNDLFEYSVVVVDNDKEKSACKLIEEIKRKESLTINYQFEPEQNIALARNKAVENANGNHIAFIDDDEYPVNDWLFNLIRAKKMYKVSGILGPVRPYFEMTPPDWLYNLCQRQSFKTGTILKSKNTRTGNVLMERKIFEDPKNRFDALYGKSGGEDTEFFSRIIKQGFSFAWCEEAPVYEAVPCERWKKSFYFKRAFLRGRLNQIRSRKLSQKKRISELVWVSALFCGYTIALPIILIVNDTKRMKFFERYFHHAGRIATVIGLNIVKQRE